ncbi:MAG: IS21 family transposase, partial [Planctomycetes bacterium]|nr:IS21 family transposase [Planctomycetota bacterium]
MDVKTARKYRQAGCPPSQMLTPHTWRTRANPFADDWLWVADHLKINPGLEAKTLFFALQVRKPGCYQDGQLRTFQRHIKIWRALEGPAREVFFEQIHLPGQWSASDFTRMNSLGITICGSPFEHMLYHFVLTYSNWETVTICYSETFESLSEGL